VTVAELNQAVVPVAREFELPYLHVCSVCVCVYIYTYMASVAREFELPYLHVCVCVCVHIHICVYVHMHIYMAPVAREFELHLYLIYHYSNSLYYKLYVLTQASIRSVV